ncbi:MAG: T9SS type A sorting domain-containing protein [Bacteroidia bacterium]|nr:T9SS type A sorting domain-containing protein [Bacteroidia bacterium]
MKKIYLFLLLFSFCMNLQIFAQQTGFVEAFDEAMVPAGVVQNSKYTFSLNLQALEVNVSRDSRWFGFDYDLGGSYDISANPVINVKLKTETDMILQLFLIDSDGKGYQTALVGSQYKYDELVPDKNEYRSARIFKGSELNTVSFDFSTVNPAIIDLKKIAKLKFVSNGTALTFVGKFTIDEFRMGNQATKMAYIGQLAERNYLKNSTGTKEVLIPEIKNAAELHVSGASLLIANAAVTPITYTTSTENGTSVQYGFAKLTYSLVADAIGSDTITLEAIGVNGFAENSMKFAINVKNNNLPTIDPVPDCVVQKDQLNEIKLTGITSGDSEANQTLTLTAISDNTSVVESIHVGYSSPDHYGKLSFSSKSAGTAKITLTVADNEGASTNTSFIATSFKSINQPPVIDPVNQLTVTNTSGQQSILLTGIGDGDHSNQTLIISATSSEPAIIPDPTIIFDQGSETATMGFNPTGLAGLANLTVTISDDGGNVENDGNKTTNLLIPVEVIVSSPTGLEFDLSASGALSYFKPENPGVAYFIAIVDTLGSKALRVTMKDKWTYAGIWMDLPAELNLSKLPVVSYDVLSVKQSTWHWNYFYDAKGQDGGQNRNTQNSGDHQFQAPADTWTTLSFDYRQPGDLNNDGGSPIDASRINALLINMHNAKPTWPFTNASGVLYMRNIKFGDKAVYTPEQVYATINPIADQSAYQNGDSQTINLSGISNGKKGIDNITITASSSSENIAAITSVSSINANGTATLAFTPLASGSSLISIKIEATGAVPVTVNTTVTVIKNDPAGYAKLTIDKTLKYQTMRGPAVINMEGFNYNAFDWNYLRDLKAKGVESFIITSWSPPAWMKRNLSLDHKEQAIEWEKTDNILEPYYYEEFAESMAALVRAMKQEAGIDILAIGLQNEPYFNEPYPSAILSGAQFVNLMKIVGDRFKIEGLSQVGFYMPEQVFGIGWGDYSCEGYLTTLKSDPIADEYCGYFAVHGYDGTGITTGFPTYNHWASMTALAKQGNHPKETWMTETYIGYSDWTSALNLAGAIHGSLWAGKISLWTNWSFDGMQVSKNAPNSSFYVSKNYFRYIRPGAVQVDSKSDNSNLLVTAFENTDGKFIMVVINKGSRPVPARIYGNNVPDRYHIYRTTSSENCVDAGILDIGDNTLIFPPGSVITLVADANVLLTMNQVADTTVAKNSGETILSIEGISDGAGSTNDLTLGFENSNEGLFSNINVSAIGTNGKATIGFTPASNQIGTAKIKLTLTGPEGTKRQVIFYVFVINPSSVHGLTRELCRIYPNPASEQLNIELSPNQHKEFTITDIAGRLILRQIVSSDHFSIDVRNWNKGIYFIKLTGDGHAKTERFVVE